MKSITTREPVRAGNSGAAGDWAICCSGGGIRSAAHCLGARQSLGQDGLVAKARWILGVSGGSYIAASRALVAHDLPRGTQPRYWWWTLPPNAQHPGRALAALKPDDRLRRHPRGRPGAEPPARTAGSAGLSRCPGFQTKATSGSASSAGGPVRPGTCWPTPGSISPTPATAPWSSCTTPPSSRPTTSSAPRRSSAQPNTANLPSERPQPGSPPSSPPARQPPQRRQSPAGLKHWLPNSDRRKSAFPIVVRLIRPNREDVNNVFYSSHRRRAPFH
jgi:hypothetical protein